jgi:hypothetical protein
VAARRRGGAGRATRANADAVQAQSAEYPDIGFPDSTADTRGGLGTDGLELLYQFVREGGTLITEGNTSAIFPSYSLTPGLRITSKHRGW